MKRVQAFVGAAALILPFAAPGCGLLPKKLSPAECEKFAEHAFSVIKKEVKKAAEDCPKAMKNMMMEAVEKTVDKEQEKLADKCKDDSKAGKTIKAKDHDCFMKGENFDDWRNCKFETEDFKDADEKFRDGMKKIKDACKKSGGGGGGDDDDDKGKKKKKGDDDDKKKKKGDDDD